MMVKWEVTFQVPLGVVVVSLLLTPIAGAAGTLTAPASAPAAAGAAPVTLSLRDVPLRTALETLFQGSGLQHAVEPAVPNYPITLDIRDVAFSTALRTLLRLAPEVTYRKEGEIFLIGMRAPQVDTTSVGPEIQPPDPPNAPADPQYAKIPVNFTQYEVMAYVLGARTIPTEADLMNGAGGQGGYGSGTGSLGGYGSGMGTGLGGSLNGSGTGLSGYGNGLGTGLGTGAGTGTGFTGPTARRF